MKTEQLNKNHVIQAFTINKYISCVFFLIPKRMFWGFFVFVAIVVCFVNIKSRMGMVALSYTPSTLEETEQEDH